MRSCGRQSTTRNWLTTASNAPLHDQWPQATTAVTHRAPSIHTHVHVMQGCDSSGHIEDGGRTKARCVGNAAQRVTSRQSRFGSMLHSHAGLVWSTWHGVSSQHRTASCAQPLTEVGSIGATVVCPPELVQLPAGGLVWRSGADNLCFCDDEQHCRVSGREVGRDVAGECDGGDRSDDDGDADGSHESSQPYDAGPARHVHL